MKSPPCFADVDKTPLLGVTTLPRRSKQFKPSRPGTSARPKSPAKPAGRTNVRVLRRSWAPTPGDIVNPVMSQKTEIAPPEIAPKPKFKEWFRVGRRVHVKTTTGPPFDAILLEDRGKRAAKQTKHLVRVRITPDNPEESIEFEVSEDRILLDAA